MGEEPNRTTRRKPGPLQTIQYSLVEGMPNGEIGLKKQVVCLVVECIVLAI